MYVPVVTLLTQDNAKLLQQPKSRFKRNIYWNKHQSKITILNRKWYLDYLTDPSFQGVNRLFVLSFETNAHQIIHTRYFLLITEINGQDFFDQPVENDLRAYDSIQKITTAQVDVYVTGCLLDDNYFKKFYEMIAIDLSKQQAPDADPKGNLRVFFIYFSLI